MRHDTLRTLLLLEVSILFALTCGELALFLLLVVVQKYSAAMGTLSVVETLPVVTAAHRIGVGDTLGPNDLKLVDYPRDFVPDNVIVDPAKVVGRVVQEPILKGDLLRVERLADPYGGDGLNALLPNGMRASSLILDGAARVAQQLNPGDHVDVIATLFEKGQPTVTQTILQGVLVLAVEEHMDHTRTRSQRWWSQITFAVDPDDAERLTQASRVGRINLSMRSPIDFEVTPDHDPTTTETLVASP